MPTAAGVSLLSGPAAVRAQGCVCASRWCGMCDPVVSKPALCAHVHAQTPEQPLRASLSRLLLLASESCLSESLRICGLWLSETNFPATLAAGVLLLGGEAHGKCELINF